MTRYGVSPWVEEFPRKRRLDLPRFRGSDERPVVIIGGGLAGCCTAYAFAAAGVKVTLLEADRLALGGASRGPGVLQGEAAASFREMDTRHGRKAARALFTASRRAVLDLATAARRLNVKGVGTTDALRLLVSYGGDDKAFARELAARRDAGLDAVALRASAAVRASGVDATRQAMKLRDWGHADPYRLAQAFARAAIERGAQLFERSRVRRLKMRRKHIEVVAEGGDIAADTLVVCTGEPTELFASLKRHVRFEERYLAITERIPARLRKQIRPRTPLLADSETPPHLIHWTDDDRLVVAGADAPRTAARGRDKVLVQRTGQLMYELSRLYPEISGIQPTHGWDLPLATPADGAMYAGPHRNYPRHLFAWGTRHDPAQAFLASRILLRHYTGAPDRDDRFFAFTRS